MLSDSSDYESSDEETANSRSASVVRSRRGWVNLSDDEDLAADGKARLLDVMADDDNLFVDPFADDVAIGPSENFSWLVSIWGAT